MSGYLQETHLATCGWQLPGHMGWALAPWMVRSSSASTFFCNQLQTVATLAARTYFLPYYLNNLLQFKSLFGKNCSNSVLPDWEYITSPQCKLLTESILQHL